MQQAISGPSAATEKLMESHKNANKPCVKPSLRHPKL